jgi:hypothetical protein
MGSSEESHARPEKLVLRTFGHVLHVACYEKGQQNDFRVPFGENRMRGDTKFK